MPTSRTGTTRARTGSRTYRGVAEIGAPRLAGLPGVHDERPEPQQLLEMERYDTADRRLTAAGIALALCRDGTQAVVYRGTGISERLDSCYRSLTVFRVVMKNR